MFSWTLVDNHPVHGRTLRRPLDASEAGFFWDGRFNGIADSLHAFKLGLLDPSQGCHLFSETNIIKAWLSTKRRYPLAGATIQLLPAAGETDNDPLSPPNPHFVVQEHDLAILRPNEIVFGQVACANEIPQRMAAILDGPRPLSDELLAQLYVFREPDSERTDTLHLMMLLAHCVADGMADRTLSRCLLDTLARGGQQGSEPAQIPLEERLEMAVPSMVLEPAHLRSLSPTRRRWRRAVATLVHQRRIAKVQGGHTLPCRRTRVTPLTPARSAVVSTMLTESQTSAVITNCRLHGLTFGNAYIALAQVAMTRVLYRRYLRGEILEEEWAYRKRQPYCSITPSNLRPYLDKEWFDNGGGGEFMVAINVFSLRLPFMTLDEGVRCERLGHDLMDDVPSFSDLLTFNRFLHRARLVGKQTKMLFSHPLFLEIMQAGVLQNCHYARSLALQWKRHAESANGISMQGSLDVDNKVLAVSDMTSIHCVSSLGSVHLISPTEYPLPSSHPLSPFSPLSHPAKAGYITPPPIMQVDMTPSVAVEDSTMALHVRPGELYLTASTSSGRTSMYVFYDDNVYEDGVVKEWLDEVEGAVLWYLGQTQVSARSHL